ncbi:MAG: methyltransferase domain-containing protein [Gammaproteobacteria bacterium]|nr:methyltransferase domain-containing protein [Gammaproteobacteria bacterium]
MALSKIQISKLYHRRAAHYDISANLYYLMGFREQAYRKRAVAALNLNPGDTVLELGCGTGLNFSLLQQQVGPEGKIIGVDLTAQMLVHAKDRVERHGWANVELVQTDAATYEFPRSIGGVLSTFALTLVPEYDAIIRHASLSLSPGRRFVVLDIKLPEKMPMWLIRFGVFVTRPFGVSLDIADRHLWESIERYLAKVAFEELYLGFSYISVGECRS